MKTLFRASALAAALVVSLFATTSHVNADTSGNCHVICINSTTHAFTSITYFTTESACCSGSFNPCPAGSTPGARSFQPLNGSLQRCAI